MMRMLLILYAFLLPYEALWIALFGSKTIFKPYRIVGLAALILFLIKRGSGASRFKFDGFDLGFFLMIGGGYLMAFVWYLIAGTANLAWANHELTLLGFVFLIYIVIKHEVETSIDAERMMLALVLGTVTSVLLSQALNVDVGDDHRVHGYFRNPNSLGVFAAMSIIIMTSRLLFGRFKNVVLGFALTGAVVLFLVPVMLSTGSRTPLIAILVAFVGVVTPLIQRSSRASPQVLRRVAAFVPVMIAAGAVVTLLIITREEGSVFARYTLEASRTGSGRFDIWRSALRLAQDHYFLGVGIGQYRFHHQTYVELIGELYSPGVYKHALGTHSDYVGLITCYGFPLTLVYLGMMVTLYRRLMAKIRARTANMTGSVVPALVTLQIFILVNQLGHAMFQGPAFFFAMSLATLAVAKQEERPRRRSLGRSAIAPAAATAVTRL